MKLLYLVVCLAALLACNNPKNISAPVSHTSSLVPDGKLWSSLFQQKAAEYKALCFQAYNIAKFRLDEALLIPSSKPKAIITDVDETFLDNSAFSVHQALLGKDYEAAAWAEWTAKAAADTIAGSLSFFKYAASKNVHVFYITNRDEKDKEGTIQNLRRYNFPFTDNDHVIVKTTTSGKETRRQAVAAQYEIVLLLGDNLSDFSALFDKKTTAERTANVGLLAGEFGKKFIVLPNANYGGWEDAIYGNSYNLNFAQKDSAIKANLKNF
jgi:5'-nucleotidase (lipoprotein e(P4) family)